jgi:glycerate kinase
LQQSGLLMALKSAGLLITAEGRLDAQSVQGKLVSALVQAASAHAVPVVVLCGALELSPAQLEHYGIAAAFPIGARPQVLAKALTTTTNDLSRTATMIGNLLAMNFPGGKM